MQGRKPRGVLSRRCLPPPLPSRHATLDAAPAPPTLSPGMSTAAKLVAVAGATGKQGGGVVAALRQLAPDLAIRALSRNPDSAGSAKLAAQSNVEVSRDDGAFYSSK